MLVKFCFYLSWLTGFFALLTLPILYPTLHLIHFAPFIILLIYKKTFYRILFGSFLSGLVLDCFTNSPLMGMEAFLYSMAAISIYRLKKNLFEEKMLTMPLMAYLFSSLMGVYNLFFCLFLGVSTTFSLEQFFKTTLLYPLIEFIYAFLLLVIPLRWLPKCWHFIRVHLTASTNS